MLDPYVSLFVKAHSFLKLRSEKRLRLSLSQPTFTNFIQTRQKHTQLFWSEIHFKLTTTWNF